MVSDCSSLSLSHTHTQINLILRLWLARSVIFLHFLRCREDGSNGTGPVRNGDRKTPLKSLLAESAESYSGQRTRARFLSLCLLFSKRRIIWADPDIMSTTEAWRNMTALVSCSV